MKSVHSSMDPETTASPDESCPSHAYAVFIKAATGSREDVEQALTWSRDIQGQCLKHIHALSQDEAMRKQAREATGFLEYDRNELIEFIAGVGVACKELTDRASSAERHGEAMGPKTETAN